MNIAYSQANVSCCRLLAKLCTGSLHPPICASEMMNECSSNMCIRANSPDQDGELFASQQKAGQHEVIQCGDLHLLSPHNPLRE